MTKGTITKELFTKCIIPLAYCAGAIFTLWSLKLQNNSDIVNYIIVVFAFGLPLGIRKMFLWLIPTAYGDLGVSVGIIIIDCVIGGLIGSFILIWFLIRGLWYMPLSIYRYIKSIKMS